MIEPSLDATGVISNIVVVSTFIIIYNTTIFILLILKPVDPKFESDTQYYPLYYNWKRAPTDYVRVKGKAISYDHQILDDLC